MLYLRTLGGLSLERDGAPALGAAGKRARLALLAVLASAGERGISRDRLLALLWPESDTGHARGALKQALYTLKRELDTGQLTSGVQELRLDPAVIGSDVRDFGLALAESNLERAVGIYRGPFLDGVFLKEAPTFERWVDTQRSVLHRQYCAALEQLARDADQRGDIPASLGWWHQLATAEPYSARAALGMMTALARAGDRAGALQYAELHEVLLREEMDLSPEDSVVALVESLRASPPPNGIVRHPSHQMGSVEPASGTARQNGSILLGVRTTGNRKWRRRLFIGVSLVAAGLLFIRAWGWPLARAATHTSSSVVAVFPFRVLGDQANAYLQQGIVNLLSRNFDGAGDLRAVDPHVLLSAVRHDSTYLDGPSNAQILAATFNAGEFVLGEIVGTPGHIRVTASLYDRTASGAALSQAYVDGSPNDVFGLVDQLTKQLLGGRARGPGSPLVRTASLTTSSLPALKAYLEGESYFASAKFPLALDAFERAVTADSTFALAYYRLSNAADWASQQELVLPAARSAVRFASRLSQHDRLLVVAHLDWREGTVEQADRDYRRLLHAYPDDIEAWYQLGELLFHRNPFRGRSFAEARVPFEQVLRLEPRNREAIVHLARIAARTADRSDVDTVSARALRIVTPDEAVEVRALRAFSIGTAAEQEHELRLLANIDATQRYTTVWRVATYTGNLPAAIRIARSGLDDRQSAPAQAHGHQMLAQLSLSMGKLSLARHELERMESFGEPDARDALYNNAQNFLLPFMPVARAEREHVAALLDSIGSVVLANEREPAAVNSVRYRGCLATLLRVFSDSVPPVADLRLSNDSDPIPVRASMHACALEVRGVVAYRAHRYQEALNSLIAGHAEAPDLRPHEHLDRFLIAESLFSLKRDDEALGWYESIADIGLAELPYRAPAAFRIGEIYARRGDFARARVNYGRMLAMWGDADPELQPMVAAARDSLRALRR